MVTPSLVIVGAPHFLSMTTLRPFGPSVTFTASASLLTPVSRALRALSSNCRVLGISLLRPSMSGVERADRRRRPGARAHERSGDTRGVTRRAAAQVTGGD